MKTVTNRALSAMKLMYMKPETEVFSVKMSAALCASGTQPQPVSFSPEPATGGGVNL